MLTAQQQQQQQQKQQQQQQQQQQGQCHPMITNLCTMLTHLCFQTKPSMLLVSKSVLAYLVTIKEVARVELHPWSGGGDGQSAA